MTRTKKESSPSSATTPPSTVLISLIRQAEGIVALLIDEQADDVISVALRRVRLDDLDSEVFTGAQRLQADWCSLQNASDLNTVWPAFWRIFWTTVPDTASGGLAIAIPQFAALKKPVATAAHPRAFKGTKYQPPKQPQVEPDLCACLLDQRLLDAFFARHDFAALPALDVDGLPLLSCEARTTAGFLAYAWHVAEQDMPVLPTEFRQHFLWHLRDRPYKLMLAWLTLWRISADAEQLSLLVKLCALAPGQIDWTNLHLQLRLGRHVVYLRAILKHRSYILAPELLTPEQMLRLDGLTDDEGRFSLYLDAVLENLGHEVSADYTLAGCMIAEMQGGDCNINTIYDCHDVPLQEILDVSAASGRQSALALWARCAKLPGFSRLLRETNWKKLSKNTVYYWLNCVDELVWNEDDYSKLLKNWYAYLTVFPICHEILQKLSDPWQEKLALMWQDFISGWDDYSTLARGVDEIFPLMCKLCMPPFSPNVDYGSTFANILKLISTEHRIQINELNSRTWLTLERACRRKDNTKLLAYGLHTLTETSPAVVCEALQFASTRLFYTACLLGGMSYERRRQFMADQVKTDWFTQDWRSMPPEDACRLLLSMSRDAGLDSPLPRRLREYFEGKLHLTSVQIARHCKLALSRLPALRLRALESAIWKSIDAPFQLRDYSAPARHALRLQAGLDSRIDSNRKGLRRILSKAGTDQASSYLDHPLNLAWYSAHPRVPQALWRTGLRLEIRAGDRDLVFAFEHDPFEILMMGTYVGSCLGVGGFCDYSTVACLLDANKQVVYARDSRGKVVARQLLAIDESDKLVCFAVYPENTATDIQTAFKAYDQELTDLLGLELYREFEESSYDVPTVLAQGWWDDGAWSEKIATQA